VPLDEEDEAGKPKGKKTPSSTEAAAAEGWFRDARLERRVRQQLLRAEAAMGDAPGDAANAAARIRAWVHSTAPASIGLVLVSNLCIDGERDNEVLLATAGPQFVLVAVVGAHPMLVADRIVYENSDGSGPAMIRTEEYVQMMRRHGEEEGAEGPTNVDDPAEVFKITEKYFKAFANDQFH